MTKIRFFCFFKPQRAVFVKFQLHKSLWLFLSDFQKSRFFGNFGHFSSKFARGTHFQVLVECGVEVFETNQIFFRWKFRILTGSTQNHAPNPIFGPQGLSGSNGTKNCIFGVHFFNWQQMLFLATNDGNTLRKC